MAATKTRFGSNDFVLKMGGRTTVGSLDRNQGVFTSPGVLMVALFCSEFRWVTATA